MLTGVRKIDERVVVKRHGETHLVPFWTLFVSAAEAVVEMEKPHG